MGNVKRGEHTSSQSIIERIKPFKSKGIHGHLPKIIAQIIPHRKQRYDTAGDYFKDIVGNERFFISSIVSHREGNSKKEFLLLIHELIEWFLTEQAGIKEEDISKFDKAHSDSDNPGSLKDAPYRKEHLFAERIEREVAKRLKVNWRDYNKSLSRLIYNKNDIPT